MEQTNCVRDRCGLAEFLVRADMSKNTFFLKYRYNPEYVALLDIKKDGMHRLTLCACAADVLRADRKSKEKHGNRGRKPTRECMNCDHLGHPRHTVCKGCGTPY